MATKPTDRILDWASGGTATDPGGGKEAAGWLVSERPPAFWWNWILNSFGQWLTYFETATDEIIARPQITYAAHLELGATPAVLWEKGNTVTIADSGGNDVWLNFGTAFGSTTDISLSISNHTINDNLILKADFSTTTRLVVQGYLDTGAKQDLNEVGTVGGTDPIIWLTVVE